MGRKHVSPTMMLEGREMISYVELGRLTGMNRSTAFRAAKEGRFGPAFIERAHGTPYLDKEHAMEKIKGGPPPTPKAQQRSAQSLEIVEAYRAGGATMQQLSERFGVSRQRVQQVCKKGGLTGLWRGIARKTHLGKRIKPATTETAPSVEQEPSE